MNVKFSRKEGEWLMKVTGTTSVQEAVNFFVRIMVSENIDPGDILLYLQEMMRKPLPPEFG